MENFEKQPTGRTNGLARFFEWWQRNGRSVMVVLASAETFEVAARRSEPEQPAPSPVVDPRREQFERWGQAINDFRAGRERAAAQIAGNVPEGGVQDDVSVIPQPGVVGVEAQVEQMREWLEVVDPRDFGSPEQPV